ncbi:MAG: PorT family protein [Bacteroidetes bacterium]|jgi:hypothetical protein|nr:PorT family protein [Bacteroidota bacterium]MBT6686468.1 PorT family protein [Bacteroidota bacterium]MBT7143575.1 PorT family protein [Bacteroidota bacterium]MBT7491373.1 PorT family protein [Bacteroidota bacterium]
MKKNYLNIDKLISKILFQHSIDPPDDAWENINNRISKNKTRKLLPIFLKIAASITLIFAIGSIFYLQNNVSENIAKQEIPSIEQKKSESTIEKIKNQQKPYSEDEKINNSKILKKAPNNSSIINPKTNDKSNTNISVPKSKSEIIIAEIPIPKMEIPETTNQISEVFKNISKLDTERRSTSIEIPEKNDIQNLSSIADNTQEEIEFLPKKKKTETKNWSIAGIFSPSYSFRNLIAGNSDSQSPESIENYDYDDFESAIISYSGGLNVEYQINSRLSFQSGVHFSRLGHSSEETILMKDAYAQNEISISSSIGKVNTYSQSGKTFESLELTRSNNSLVDNSETVKSTYFIKNNMIYKFDYLELPLIVKYKLIDKKLDFQVLAGLNSGILVNNNVYLESDNYLQNIGKTDDLKSINYAGVFGFGIEYSLFKRTTFLFEPTLKYSLLPISENEQALNYYAYSFAVFTGIKYTLK